jgi:acetyl esterase
VHLNRRCALYVIALVVCGCLGAQAAHTCSKLNAPIAANYFLEGVQTDIQYRNGLKLDAYSPSGSPRPAALIIHGGSGDKSTHVTQLFPLLVNVGYAWFSVNYRDLSDVQAAVKFITCPGRFSIDQELVLIGEDKGVSLALELAHHAKFRRIIGFGASSNVAAMTDPGIPVALFHGSADEDSNPAALQKVCAGWKQCRFYAIDHGIHNLENWHPDQWGWKEEFTAILRNGRRGLWKDIVYSRPGGLPLLMDAHLPEGRGPFPAVIVVHGGGWEAGDRLTYISPVLSLLSRAGFAWFSIDYRLTPYVRNEEQLEDLRNAIRYVRNHAERFDIDPHGIAILGESAGGQIVTQVASEACPGCDVQAVVSFYGVYDFVPWAAKPDTKPLLDRVFGSWDIDKLPKYSPISHIHRDMPPVLMLQGTADDLYDGTLKYEKQLEQVGVRHQLILLDKAPHGMENWVGHPEWAFYETKLTDWLHAMLRPGS